MKYFKDQNDTVYAFDKDGSQDAFITEQMVAMTKNEIDRHLDPEKYFSDEEKQAVYLKNLIPLTRRQFMLTLVEYELDDDIKLAIQGMEDVKKRKIINIEFNDAQIFERFSESIVTMATLLNLDDQQLNAMWEHALTL